MHWPNGWMVWTITISILTKRYPPPTHLDEFKLKKHCEIVIRSLTSFAQRPNLCNLWFLNEMISFVFASPWRERRTAGPIRTDDHRGHISNGSFFTDTCIHSGLIGHYTTLGDIRTLQSHLFIICLRGPPQAPTTPGCLDLCPNFSPTAGFSGASKLAWWYLSWFMKHSYWNSPKHFSFDFDTSLWSHEIPRDSYRSGAPQLLLKIFACSDWLQVYRWLHDLLQVVDRPTSYGNYRNSWDIILGKL